MGTSSRRRVPPTVSFLTFRPEQVGVIHDAGNMVHEGFENYQMGCELLGPYLAHVHVKNAAWVREAGDPPASSPDGGQSGHRSVKGVVDLSEPCSGRSRRSGTRAGFRWRTSRRNALRRNGSPTTWPFSKRSLRRRVEEGRTLRRDRRKQLSDLGHGPRRSEPRGPKTDSKGNLLTDLPDELDPQALGRTGRRRKSSR
ncbi:MAG: hypothetical protein KatS3mg115_2642 [Candidatus Poribacteria bacterium]|nr:MAG: hypothetical protein KatS3mg115_2642 [Candidatus Poribacteria bacterium]